MIVALIAVVVALAIAFAGSLLYVRLRPLEAFVRMMRRGLVHAGMRAQTLQVNDAPVVYWSGGSGTRTLMLVHGVNDQAGTWVSVVPALMKEFRVLAIDLPGHGDSAPKSGPIPMRQMIDAVAAVIDRESPDAPVVVTGNSMGGWVSILYASEQPQRVAHLVLEDASGMTYDLGERTLFPKTREEAIVLLRKVHGPTAKIPDFLVENILHSATTMPQARVLAGGIAEWLADARLSLLQMPVSLIWGRHDGLLPIAYAEALRARIPGSTLDVIDAAAHIPHRQTPGEFVRLLLARATASV
jgi:pimeloyl-ACP methyl ester carboxylesterase